jgi:hypothetical protein
MGVPSVSFIDTYSAKVTDLMISLVEYVQAIDKIRNPPNPSQVFSGPDSGTNTNTPNQMEKNANGFFILPDPIPSEAWKKSDWDRLFTDYLGNFYHLACGGNEKHIPYKRISDNQKVFIEPKYLPRKTSFRPPRNIPLKEIKGIFDHFLERQRKYGPEEAFKFKSIKLKGQTVPAQYSTHVSDSELSPVSDSGPGPGATTNCPSSTGPPSNSNSIPNNNLDNNITTGNNSGFTIDDDANSCQDPGNNTGPTVNEDGNSCQGSHSCLASLQIANCNNEQHTLSTNPMTRPISNFNKQVTGPGPAAGPVTVPSSNLTINNDTNSTSTGGIDAPRPRPRPRPIPRRITRSHTKTNGPGPGTEITE